MLGLVSITKPSNETLYTWASKVMWNFWFNLKNRICINYLLSLSFNLNLQKEDKIQTNRSANSSSLIFFIFPYFFSPHFTSQWMLYLRSLPHFTHHWPKPLKLAWKSLKWRRLKNGERKFRVIQRVQLHLVRLFLNYTST